MADDKNRVFVYINVFAAAMMDEPVIKEFLSEKLNTKEWRGFKNDLSVLPTCFDETTDPTSFFDGVSFQQFISSRDEGVYINAMYPGLMGDKKKWGKVIDPGNFTQTSMYVDIPYEVYEKAIGDKAKPSKEIYDKQSARLQELVGELSVQPDRVLH